MSKNKYLTIKDSSVYTDTYGNAYPDIFTFNINSFTYTEKPVEYYLEDNDIQRFDLLMYNYYGSSDYDTYVLWLNGIGHIADEKVGTKIYLPAKTDIDAYISGNLV
jgi:hypothetical protein